VYTLWARFPTPARGFSQPELGPHDDGSDRPGKSITAPSADTFGRWEERGSDRVGIGGQSRTDFETAAFLFPKERCVMSSPTIIAVLGTILDYLGNVVGHVFSF